jgi:flagellar motor switch protein FliN/FliY
MATKKTKQNSDPNLELPGNEAELDQAIDDLRGVLKTDADGGMPDFGDRPRRIRRRHRSLAFGGDLEASGDTTIRRRRFRRLLGLRCRTSFSAIPSKPSPPAPLGSAMQSNIDLIMDIPIDVQIMLGSSRMQVSGLMNLNEGATIALDKKIGEPVEIMVNGRKIARGEITVLENDDTRFGVKLIEVLRY